jgi:glycosyltransferase involved in cell wall biosynthesis
VALLAPHKRGLSLDWWTSEARFSLAFPRQWSADPLTPDPDWLAAVRRCGERTGARLVHVEGVTGLSLPSLVELAAGSVPVVLSIYDFALFCRRPHLWTADETYCDFCTDLDVCRTCLGAAGDGLTIDQRAHREASARLLERVAAVVCPTVFVRDRILAHFPTADASRFVIIPPGIVLPDLGDGSVRDPDQIAIVGSLQPHKGGALAVAVGTELAMRGRDVTVYGGNGHAYLRQLRNVPGVEIRGYYTEGRLPELLVEQRASVALVLSQVPETFALVVSEAWAAGVPVVTSGMGALGERLAPGGGVALEGASLDEIVGAVDALRSRPVPVPTPPSAASAATAHTALYLALSGEPTPLPPNPPSLQ